MITESNKKIVWISKTKDIWILLLEINNDEIYKITIKSNNKYPYPYSIYKFDRFIENSKSWSINKTKSNYPLIVLTSIKRIFLYHIYSNNINIVVSTINILDEDIKKRKLYCKNFFNFLQENEFNYVESEQETFYAYVAFKINIQKKLGNLQIFVESKLPHFSLEV